jgi:hypothetical protein
MKKNERNTLALNLGWWASRQLFIHQRPLVDEARDGIIGVVLIGYHPDRGYSTYTVEWERRKKEAPGCEPQFERRVTSWKDTTRAKKAWGRHL